MALQFCGAAVFVLCVFVLFSSMLKSVAVAVAALIVSPLLDGVLWPALKKPVIKITGFMYACCRDSVGLELGG